MQNQSPLDLGQYMLTLNITRIADTFCICRTMDVRLKTFLFTVLSQFHRYFLPFRFAQLKINNICQKVFIKFSTVISNSALSSFHNETILHHELTSLF